MHVRKHRLVWSAFSLCWLFMAGGHSVLAQLPVARLIALFPPGGQIGTTVDVAAQGADLDEPVRLQFSHAGITTLSHEGTQFKIAIASNVPPSTYEARFVGRFGLSNPRRFVVGNFPQRIVPATNAAPGSATELAINSTCFGKVEARSTAWFKFVAKKNQRLWIECLASSIDSRLDPTLLLSDRDGREWEQSRAGGLLDFIVPADGAYLLRVADLLYRGGDDYAYRLSLSSGPRVDYVLPLAGVAGTRTNFTVFGRNLPGGKPVKGLLINGKPVEQATVSVRLPTRLTEQIASSVPASAGLDTFAYQLKDANPVLIALVNSNAPIRIEQEPNSKPGQAQAISLPCEISGQFYPAGDVDRYNFEARKGDVFWVEVLSHRLGLPTAPFVLVQRVTKTDSGEKTTDVLELGDSDANLGEREFNTASRDPSGRFEAKEDGTYRLSVRDLFSSIVSSPLRTYHLSIRREAPDFRLVAQVLAPKYKSDAKNVGLGVPLLRRGETLAVRVMAFRRDGFNGEIALAVEKPPPGLSFVPDRIEAGKSMDYFLLTATTDAPAYAGPIELVGRAKVGDREIVRMARGGTTIFPVENVDNERPQARVISEFSLAITDQESAPLAIAPAENRTWEVATNGKLEVPLTITRRADFNANLKVKPLGPGAQDALKEFDVEGKATNAVLKLDFAALKLPSGRHVFSAQSITTGKYRNNPEGAALAEGAAKEADKVATETAAAAKKASEDAEAGGKTADAAEALAKTAAEKLATTQSSAANDPANEALKTELATAKQASEDAAAAARSAVEAKMAALKAKSAAESKAKEAQARKEASAKKAKELSDKAKPRDVNYLLNCAPIVVQVNPAPVADGKSPKQADK
jgi:hypothetical protein